MTVSAPGKLILAGEYAVLEGSLAIVAAVSRRAVATRGKPEESEFLDEAANALRAGGLADAADAIATIAVDTSALCQGETKLGLGSSAAATVAAIGEAFARTKRPLDRALILKLAREAHKAAQGGQGSGADVAAATYGGTIAFRHGTPMTIWLPDVIWMPLWTGSPADTTFLVRAVMAKMPDLSRIAEAADALAVAETAEEVIAAISAGGDAIARLADHCNVDLEGAEVRAARGAARRAGGALKTCGAGGGDIAIAVFPPGTDTSGLARIFRAHGLTPLDLSFDSRGVDIEPGGD